MFLGYKTPTQPAVAGKHAGKTFLIGVNDDDRRISHEEQILRGHAAQVEGARPGVELHNITQKYGVRGSCIFLTSLDYLDANHFFVIPW